MMQTLVVQVCHFGKETSGDRELDDVVMSVQNQIAETNLTVLSPSNTLKNF